MPSAAQICDTLWIAWLITWVIWAFQSKQTRQKEGLASQIAYRLPILIFVALMVYARRHEAGLWAAPVLPRTAWLGALAVLITAAGFAFTLWARAILGGNWSGTVTIKIGHELVRSGPYRLVRHPIYTGVIVAVFGSALAWNQWSAFAAVPLLWVSFTVKRLKEEQFMRQTFGPQYDDYARTTGAIFPLKLHPR